MPRLNPTSRVPEKMAANPAGLRHVAAIPYPGRGHVNAMLSLCRRLLLNNNLLHVSFVVTEEWAHLITTSGPPLPANLRLVAVPNCIPSESVRADDPSGFIDAVFTNMEAPFEAAAEGMRPPPAAIVADSYLPWAVAVGERRSVPVYSLYPMAPSFFSALYSFERIPARLREAHVTVGTDEEEEGETDEPLCKYIPGHNSLRLSDLSFLLNSDRRRKQALGVFSMVRKANCVLFTSFYELGAQVIDTLREQLHCPVYTIGPSIPYMKLEDTNNNIDHIEEWLNSQPKESVLYISLGSFLSVSGAQMDEIAVGLKLSGARFMWVVRGDSSSRLQEMAGEMGIIVPWCHQLKVLNHCSIGEFLTHCGWNSTLEGVFCGVPMLTFPIFRDQFVDSRLIVDDWKIGLNLRGNIKSECVVGGEEISSVVKKLMDLDCDESREMRRRAAELRASARRAISDGGSSTENLNSIVRALMLGDGH